MLNTCDLNHEKIVFEGSDCPLCKAIELIDDLKIKMSTIEDDFNEFVFRYHKNEEQNLARSNHA